MKQEPKNNFPEMIASSEVLTKSFQKRERGRQHGCQHVDWIEGLHHLSRAVACAPDLDSVVRNFLVASEHVVNVRAVTVRLRDPITRDLNAIACKNLNTAEWKSAIPQGAVGLSKVAVESAAPVMLLDIQHHPSTRCRSLLRRYGLVSYLGIPCVVRGQVMGVIGFYSKNTRGFRSDEIQYLTALTDLITVALHDAQLREHSAEQAVHLRSANVTAQKFERAKSEFLGVMSHEFRTPLSLIMGHAGMMHEGMLGELNSEQRSSLDRILQCSDDLLAMVMSILEASTIETGAVRVEKQVFDPKDLLEELRAGFTVPEGKDLDLVWNWPEFLPRLETDREKLRVVLEHLIDNAFKFCDRGRVVISAEVALNPSMIMFTIADTGIGIAPEAIPFVFEKFRQSDSSTTRSHGGVGLGLFIAKKFTELLGGELSLHSEFGKGTISTITLPAGD